MDVSLAFAIGSLVIAALGGYFGIVRRASGKIQTSEASELWEESRAIRVWATQRIKDLNETVATLEAKVTELEHAHEDCQNDNRSLRQRITELEAA
jgi:septal ring factor EnvC (AmiA/AmiB activator)